MIQGRQESALYTTVKWGGVDFIDERWPFASVMHKDKARVRAVFVKEQQVVHSLEECSSGGIFNKTDLLLNRLFTPRYTKWSHSLAIAVEHSDTVDLKGTEESLIFYCDVPQEEGDIIKARNYIGSIAALAGVVQGCGGLLAECGKELSGFQFPARVTERPALELRPKLEVRGLFSVDDGLPVGVLKTIVRNE